MLTGIDSHGSPMVPPAPRPVRSRTRIYAGGSVVEVRNVRASVPYGDGISATPYHRTDRNGYSAAIFRDAARSEIRASAKRDKREARHLADRDRRRMERAAIDAERNRVASAERSLAGTIGNVD